MLVVAAANLKKREEKGTSVVAATHLPERVVLLADQVRDVPGGLVILKAISQPPPGGLVRGSMEQDVALSKGFNYHHSWH